MNRQTKFEQLWADRHGISPADLIQYRFKEKDGYRLPAMAAHYRTFCDALDSVAVQLPQPISADGITQYMTFDIPDVKHAIEAAGGSIAP